MVTSFKTTLGRFSAMAAVLAVAVLVTFVTVEVSTQTASRLIEQKTEERLHHGADIVASSIDAAIVNNSWCVNSFLAGVSYLEYRTDSLGNKYPYHWIGDRFLNLITSKVLVKRLSEFLTVNYDYLSAVIIFDPGVLAQEKGGVALGVKANSLEVFDLTEELDVFTSETYNKARKMVKPFYTRLKYYSESDGLAFSYVIPLYDKDGDFIGAFMVDNKLSDFSDYLVSNISQKEMSILFIDYYGDVLMTSDPAMNSVILGNYKPEVNDKFFQFSTNDSDYDVYVYKSKECGLTLFAYFQEESSYAELESYRSEMLWLSIGCMLVLLICVGFVFYSYRKRENFRIMMDRELSIASSIQKNILPRDSISGPGYSVTGLQRSARAVGGDLYDYLERDGKIFFCIGDVSGKGVPASMFMAMASSHFRSACRESDDPGEIASSINEALAERNQSCMFCTMFVGVLDASRGTLAYCNAGHNDPVVLSSDGKAAVLSAQRTVPLGVETPLEIKMGSLQLGKGDTLFLYTDGVTEAVSPEGRMFAVKGLVDALEAKSELEDESLEDKVMRAVERFSAKADQRDDITMLSIKIS